MILINRFAKYFVQTSDFTTLQTNGMIFSILHKYPAVGWYILKQSSGSYFTTKIVAFTLQ